MDNTKTGDLIRRLRIEKSMTQKQLAEKLHVSNKAVSKWERGFGSPDISLLAEISRLLGVDVQTLLTGELNQNAFSNGNIKKTNFYVCPVCGNLILAAAYAAITCCGRMLKPQIPTKATDNEKLSVQKIETDFFVSSEHEMTREHYIAFVALLTGDTLLLKKQYPEWNLQVRIPFFAHGKLIWYCTQHGLFYQEV